MLSRKSWFIIAAAVACLIFTLSAFFAARAIYKPVPKAAAKGSLKIEVVDGFTDLPIEGASVIIPEINKSFITGEDGRTPLITVPVLTDSRYDETLKQGWGGISVLVYCQGYIDYALFYAHVTQGEERAAVKIYLFQEGSTGSSQPFSIIEGPDRQWVKEILDKYRPQ